MSDETGELEVLQRSRRYLLVVGDDFYGVWDIDAEGDGAIERFPLTDDGDDEAEARFRTLRRLDRRRRWPAWRVVAASVGAVAVLWILSGVASAVVFHTGLVAFPVYGRVVIAEGVLFSLAIGGLILLVVLVLMRLARRIEESPRRNGGLPGSHTSAPHGPLTTVILGTGALGLAVWIGGVAAQIALPVYETLPFTQAGTVGFAEMVPSRSAALAEAIGSVGLRTWISSLVVLLIIWGRAMLFRADRPPEADGG